MTIRKRIDELSNDDLIRFPIWEFADDEEGIEGQDETTVCPAAETARGTRPAAGVIVRCVFTLADGSGAEGHLTIPIEGENDLGVIQPVLISKGRRIVFWCGVLAPTRDYIGQSYLILSRQPSGIFPLRFESAHDSGTPLVAGVVPGFMVLEDWRTGRVRVVQ